MTHWKRLWCWEGLGAGGEGDDRGWDGWMASPTRWTWVWVKSGSWWWTGRPGVLWFMGSQRVGHDWVTELNWNWLSMAWPLRLLRLQVKTKWTQEEELMLSLISNFKLWMISEGLITCRPVLKVGVDFIFMVKASKNDLSLICLKVVLPRRTSVTLDWPPKFSASVSSSVKKGLVEEYTAHRTARHRVKPYWAELYWSLKQKEKKVSSTDLYFKLWFVYHGFFGGYELWFHLSVSLNFTWLLSF